MTLTFFGIISVVIASFLHDSLNESGSHNKYHIYIFFMLIALLLYSFQKIGEEYILQKAEFATRRFVGIQGVIGIGIISIFQIIIIFIVSFKKGDGSFIQFLNNFMGGKSLIHISKSNINYKNLIIRCYLNNLNYYLYFFFNII